MKKNTKPKQIHRKFESNYWNNNKGKIVYNWRILGADPKSKIHYPSHQRVLVECVKCGYKTSVVGYSLLQGLSKQCKGCVNRKYQVGHGVTDGRKENLNSKVLNQTWRKYRNLFCDEWKNSYDKFATFFLDKLHWKPWTYRITRIDTKKLFAPDNVILVKNTLSKYRK